MPYEEIDIHEEHHVEHSREQGCLYKPRDTKIPSSHEKLGDMERLSQTLRREQ